jgi:hypothetical protein
LRTPDGSSSGCGEGAGDLFEMVGDELHFSTSHDDATGRAAALLTPTRAATLVGSPTGAAEGRRMRA